MINDGTGIRFVNGAKRDATGRFLPGTAPGPGNPMARRTAEYRAAIREAVSPEDLAQIIKVLMEKALAGDVQAAREVLDRILGKAKVSVEVEEPRRSVEEMRTRLLAKLNEDPHMLRRALGLPLPPVIDNSESGVAG